MVRLGTLLRRSPRDKDKPEERPGKPAFLGPPLVVLIPDVAGVSSFRQHIFPDAEAATRFILSLSRQQRERTHAFWALQEEPAGVIDGDDTAGEATVLIRSAEGSDLVYVVSFVDIESAQSFARFEVKRGMHLGLMLVYWASMVNVVLANDGVQLIPEFPPQIHGRRVQPKGRTAEPRKLRTDAEPERIKEDASGDQANGRQPSSAPPEAEEQIRLAAEVEEQRRLAAVADDQRRRVVEVQEQKRLAAEADHERRLQAEADEPRRLAAEAEEQQRIATAVEEQHRVAAEGQERRRLESEAEEKRRVSAAAEERRLAAQAEGQRQREAAADEQQRVAAEAEQQRRVAAEAEAQRQREAEAQEQRRVAAEVEEQRRLAAEAEEQRQREAEVEDQQRVAAEAEQRRRLAAEAEEQRQREAAAEELRVVAEAEEQRVLEVEAEGQRRLAEAEAEEQQRLAAQAEEWRRQAEAEENQRALGEAEERQRELAEAAERALEAEAEERLRRAAEAQAERDRVAEVEMQRLRDAMEREQRRVEGEPHSEHPGDVVIDSPSDGEPEEAFAGTLVFQHSDEIADDASSELTFEPPNPIEELLRQESRTRVHIPSEYAREPESGASPESPEEDDASVADEVGKILRRRRWEKRESPFEGFNSPPGRF